jgi:hypothetical protein
MPTADRAPRKRQRTSEAAEDDSKKQRGRPRVEGQDETAADVCHYSLKLMKLFCSLG